MTTKSKKFYSEEVQAFKKAYYAGLPEKAKRHFLGQEYLYLGAGSQRYLSRVFGCGRQTIIKGTKEVSSPDFRPDYKRQRSKGGGRKKKEELFKQLTQWILDYVETDTQGSPTNPNVKWTALKPRDIAAHIKTEYGIEIPNNCVKRILKNDGYVRRKPTKDIPTGRSKHRQEQFRILMLLVAIFTDMPHNPILSIDTKKKERLGQLTRNEAVLTKKDQIPRVFSSDYSFLAMGKAIPHGIYDKKLNKGYLSIGNSNETADFIIDNLRWWWYNFGKVQYKNATYIMLLSDCGGSNSYRHHRFKVLLQGLATELGLKIVVVHYPPYCSKYNPIERKLFSHVHRTIQNSILYDVEQVEELMSKTSTTQGLEVETRVVDKFYPLKQPSNKEDIDESRILRHPTLPQFSYTLLP